MSTWVVVPVKPLRLAKSRLAEVLTPEQRQQLAETMLRHVLSVVRSVPQVTGTLVISRDNRVLAIAREYGAKTVQESGTPELNAALMRATRIIASWRSDMLLILPADLPLLAPQDITALLGYTQADDDPCVVVAPDRNHDGTNALLVRPPGLLNYAYGPGSFQRHAVQARDAGATVYTYHSERLVQDIDLPEDLENFYRMQQHGTYNPPLPMTYDAIQTLLDAR
ncbi:MAG: 2-phospho-L-lactate guanylyltransferase [Armatimonadetes bacterium]|nr:2-phospho-L-lactate guanylyltransferase [Anaerolineae bacterium]